MEAILERYRGADILITGGTGFIGLNLIKVLRRVKPNITVTFFTKNKLDLEERELLRDISTEYMDIRDRDTVEKMVIGKDYIFHLAGHSGAIDSMKNPYRDIEINCIGSLNLLEACRRLNPEAVILSLGSRLQFGKPQYLPVDEDHPLWPTSVHGVSKITVEKYFLLYNRLYKLNTIYFRVTNPYGPFQRKEDRNFGIVNIFIQKALRGDTIEIFGEGAQLRDYVYIDDLIEAMLYAPLMHEAYGEVFNIGSGRGISLLEMVETIIKITGRGTFKKVRWPKEFKKVETGDFIADISKARRILHWQPRENIKSGLKKVIQVYL